MIPQEADKTIGIYIRDGVGDEQYFSGEYAWESSKIHLELICPQTEDDIHKCMSLMRNIVDTAESTSADSPEFSLISLKHVGSKAYMIGRNEANREVMVSNLVMLYTTTI